MMRCELNELYNSPWGILARRRAEAEQASYGKFEAIYDAAIAEDFYSIEAIAERMGCHPRTATKRLGLHPVRYIEHKGRHWYHKQDSDEIIKAYATNGSE